MSKQPTPSLKQLAATIKKHERRLAALSAEVDDLRATEARRRAREVKVRESLEIARPRPHVMAAYEAGCRQYGSLYQQLAAGHEFMEEHRPASKLENLRRAIQDGINSGSAGPLDVEEAKRKGRKRLRTKKKVKSLNATQDPPVDPPR